MTDDQLKAAIEYNNRRGYPGKLTTPEFARLVDSAQLSTHDPVHGGGLRHDGKYGPLSQAEFNPKPTPQKGDRHTPTPDPATWADWVYPIDPIMLGGELRPFKISSGFTMYGKGEDPDRGNHWGVDLMLKRFEGDAMAAVNINYPKLGVAQAPVFDPWWFCPHAVPIRAVGPGHIWSVHMGTNNNVMIDHHDVPGFGPVTTWYQHMDEVHVKDGQEVKAGDIIGTIGDGSTNLNHLHFEFRNHNRGGSQEQSVENPRQYLKLFRVG